MTSSSSSSKIDDSPIPMAVDDATATQEVADDEAGPDDDAEQAVIRLSELESENLQEHMDYFIYRVETDEYKSSKQLLKLFTSHSCADSFSLIYLSRLEENRKLGSHLIKRFLEFVYEKLDRKLLAYAAPSVVRFCALLRKTGLQDPVYCDCLEKLRWIFFTAKYEELVLRRLRKGVEWKDIFLHVLDLGDTLLEDIGLALVSRSVDIVKFKGGDEFSVFVRFLVQGILESANFEIPIPMRYYRALGNPYFAQLRSLYELFYELVCKMDLCLARGDQYLSEREEWTCEFRDVGCQYLNLLKALSNISKIYQCAGERFQKMLEKRKDTFRYLVKEYANYDCIHVDEEFSWIFEHKELLGFECRWLIARKVFLSFLEDDNVNNLVMEVDRLRFLDDSCDQINQADSKSLQVEDGLFVKFTNERATGVGVIREWFVLVCKEIFNPQNALFIYNEDDHRRFRINPASCVQDRHLEYFRFCGRVMGLAMLYQVQVGVTVDRILFKQLAGLDIQLEDIKNTDPTMYSSCTYILNMNADSVDADALGLTFSTEFVEFGSRKVVELLPGGECLKVNSTNREKYVDKLIYHRFCVPTLNQVEHLSEGISDIFPNPDYLNLFFRCIIPEDLDRVLRGSESDISVEDWKAHTDYSVYKETSREIVWFWKIIKEMSSEDQRLLLFFWTALTYLPFEGFSGLPKRLKICRAGGTSGRLPTSRTCFYQLNIPRYPTLETMQQRIAVIIQEHFVSGYGKK